MRCESRVALRLKVRIYGKDSRGREFDLPCEAHDASIGGARLLGALPNFKPGDVFMLQHQNLRARFRVKWVAPRNGGLVELGVESLLPCRNLWKRKLPNPERDSFGDKAPVQPAWPRIK